MTLYLLRLELSSTVYSCNTPYFSTHFKGFQSPEASAGRDVEIQKEKIEKITRKHSKKKERKKDIRFADPRTASLFFAQHARLAIRTCMLEKCRRDRTWLQ